MEGRSDDAVLVHKGRGDLIVQSFTIAGAATKKIRVGTTGILTYPFPVTLPVRAEGDGSGVLRAVSMEEEAIHAHLQP